ncbi:MAG TPA: helix-turn-helix domain-containing protein [Nitrospiria bacterium]|nr:helix-turn-helix domain-containing protein [Nitrospiria bacterium]
MPLEQRINALRPDGVEQACLLASQGFTDAQIAAAFGVREVTVNRWKKENREFEISLKKGKIEADSRVTKGLYQRAIGYDYEEVHTEALKSANNKPAVQRIKKITRHVPPDVIAQIFWLKNRQPEMWRDKHDVHHQSQVGVQVEIMPPLSRKEKIEEVKEKIRILLESGALQLPVELLGEGPGAKDDEVHPP